MSVVNKDGDTESQSLAVDALPMAPRESSHVSRENESDRQNDNEPTSSEQHGQSTETRLHIPEPPIDWNFNIFLNNIAENLTTEDLVNMKWFFEGEGGLGKGVLEKIKTPRDLFRIMRTRGYITRDNLLYLQVLLYQAGRKDLIKDGVEYAKHLGNVLHFYAPSYLPENGYKYVKFHVDGFNFQTYTRDDIETLRRKVSALLFVPAQFVFIAGIEPSSSLVITMMIPDLYVQMLRDLLEEGDDLAALNGTGVDVIDIHGEKSYNIKSTGDNCTEESEQTQKLVNVYEQLKRTKECLDSSEMTCIKLYRKIDEMQKTIQETEDNLRQMQNEVHALKSILSMSEDTKEPASLKEQSSLKEFIESLRQFNAISIDKQIVRRMIDSTITIVSTRVRESHRIREQRLEIRLQDMQSQLAPLIFENQTLKFFDGLSNIDKSVIDSVQKLFEALIGHEENISLTPLGMQMLANISSKLNKREREKLKKKYKWTPNGDIERFMEQDQNLLLAGLYYKEISIKQADIHLETFIAQCLSEVNRDDLKKFLDPKYYQIPQSQRKFAEEEQKADNDQRQSHDSQQKYKKSQTQRQGQWDGQGPDQKQQEQTFLIKRMASQMDEMYNMLQTRSQNMFEPKFEDWKTPSFSFQSNAFQPKTK